MVHAGTGAPALSLVTGVLIKPHHAANAVCSDKRGIVRRLSHRDFRADHLR
jgi:hypothetical protein